MMDELNNYLTAMFGDGIALKLYRYPVDLPAVYKSIFTLLHEQICDNKCIFALDNGSYRITPLQIRKFVSTLEDCIKSRVIYVGRLNEPHELERLIAMQVPFISPGRHIYLPFAGLSIGKPRKNILLSRNCLTTYSQLSAFAFLMKKFRREICLDDVTGMFKCSKTSAANAFCELEYFGIGHKERQAGLRDIYFRFDKSGQEMWEELKPICRNPCKRIVGLSGIPNSLSLVSAGETALSQMSMLSSSDKLEYAVSLSIFNKLNLKTVPVWLSDVSLQLWSYRPDIFNDGIVDIFSLALTLKESQDDRVQICLENAFEVFNW